VITDFIFDKAWKYCDNELEQTKTLLHGERSKQVELVRQDTTEHPRIVSKPINKKGPEIMRRNMRGKCPRLQMIFTSYLSKKYYQ